MQNEDGGRCTHVTVMGIVTVVVRVVVLATVLVEVTVLVEGEIGYFEEQYDSAGE